MQITTLIENDTHPDRQDLEAEHGLSFYIEANQHVYLSDVGKSGKFADNAARLGLNLKKVEVLAISHHHYDHGGGLGRFFMENDRAQVFLRQTPTEDFVVDSPPDPLRYIGLDKGLLNGHNGRIKMVPKSQEVAPGLHLLTEIPDKFRRPDGDLRLQVMRADGGLQPDDFKHELVTVVTGENGLILLTGCAHCGVLNMLAAVHEAFPGQPIQAVVGGFHLQNEDLETIQEVGEKLLEEGIPVVVSGHCTGEKAIKLFKDYLGDRFQRLNTGMSLSF